MIINMFNVGKIWTPPRLKNCSPSDIQRAARSGNANAYFAIGDCTSEISIGTFDDISATSACAYIIGFDHNSSIEGLNSIHFLFGQIASGKDIAFYSTKMNSSSTNSGGWSSSRMRRTICPAFLAALPSEWQNVISETTKKTDNTGGGNGINNSITETTDKIFLLAEYEVRGECAESNTREQYSLAQYDYYVNGGSKVKYKHNGTSATCAWWLRSPSSSVSNMFCRVGTNGVTGSTTASDLIGFAPAFRVG